MGLFDFFRRRRRRESAVQSLELTAEPSTQVPPLSGAALGSAEMSSLDAADATAAGGVDLAQLGQIGAMIAQAAQQGNIQVTEGETQAIDLRGTGLREEFLEIMSRHGIDAESGSGTELDASSVPGLQDEILEALGRQGVDLEAFLGEGAQVRLEQPGDEPA